MQDNWDDEEDEEKKELNKTGNYSLFGTFDSCCFVNYRYSFSEVKVPEKKKLSEKIKERENRLKKKQQELQEKQLEVSSFLCRLRLYFPVFLMLINVTLYFVLSVFLGRAHPRRTTRR